MKPLVLTGSKVKLVPMEEHHADSLYEVGQYPEIWQFTQIHISTWEDAREYVRTALEQPNAMPFVIVEQDTQRIVGSTRLYDISAQHRSLEIGSTWLTPAVWRSSVNTECKYLLLKHSFEALDMIRVQLKTDSRNVRSQAAIERIGATREGVFRNHLTLPNGYVRDSVYFSILDREWPEVKARLEYMLGKPSITVSPVLSAQDTALLG
ncbi:GNAT family N-acetyltransferase [Paenibacillus massiliensis]|uniref:GNAT family N-acetyltransferase n=1 Tax=Paenibacillus massiliensis TaxID=225917 RepID=UPI000471FA1B|nr:GNAT family protein [Paenibacillus massiliensis]